MPEPPFVYPGKSVVVMDGETIHVPLGAGPPFPHVVIASRDDGSFVLRRALASDDPDVVREPGNGPDLDEVAALLPSVVVMHRRGEAGASQGPARR